MDPTMVALAFVILGMLLIIVEAFSPGVYMIIPGTVLLVIGIIGYISPDFILTWMSPVVALIIAVPVTLLTVLGYKYLGKPEPPTTTVMDSLVNREGIVTVTVSPNNMKGKVRIGSDTWSAESDEVIPVGAEIRVVSGSGVHLHVKKL